MAEIRRALLPSPSKPFPRNLTSLLPLYPPVVHVGSPCHYHTTIQVSPSSSLTRPIS